MKNIIVANQAQTSSDNLTAAYKAADKTISDTVTTNKTNQDAAIASAIANWASDRQYKADQITIRNKTFFLALKDNIGRDPLTDTAGNWSVFTPGSANDVFANRSPVASDVYPAGVKWWDVSFGADTPLGFVSLGNGAWQFLNQISLSKIRFFGHGTGSTYQSNLNSIKFFKADGTQIPNGWFVWGASSGLGKPTNGVAFSGQSITGGYNSSGWADLEPSSLFDLSVDITKITASSGYFTFTKLQFIYSNGGIKTFTSLGDLSPAPQSRYGDSIAAALGETLTSAKLSNSSNLDPGRVTGEAFVSAWNVLYQAQPKASISRTIHNFGTTAVTTLVGATDNLAEVHLEGGEGYSIAAADWEDGQSIRFVHTAGANTAERLVVAGFAGAYLRDGQSRNISDGMFIGRQDCQFVITITENGGQKYLNIDDRSPDAAAIWAYPPIIPEPIPPAPRIPYNPTSFIGKLVTIESDGRLTRANAIAPNALPALYYVDAWSDMLTPLYGDGKVFNLPAAVASAPEGSDLYLGASGDFSLTPPTITPDSGDLRQPVAVVLRGGKGITKFRAAARVV